MRALALLAALAVAPAAALAAPDALDGVCLVHFPLGNHDATRAAADEVPADVALGTTAGVGGTLAARFGAATPFEGLRFVVSVPGVAAPEAQFPGTMSWRYWSGAGAWRALDVPHDARFLAPGAHDVGFRAPGDWAPRAVECGSAEAYWVSYSWDRPHLTSPHADQVLALR